MGSPSAYELFRQIPSSQGELTLQLETRTFVQQSISIPSRLVSIFRLSMVRLFTPVARMPTWPPCKIEKSRTRTFLHFLSAIALFPTPGCSALGHGPYPLLNPLPQIKPGPRIATLSRSSPQIKLLCQ